MTLEMDLPHQNHYVPRHIYNRYINSYRTVFGFFYYIKEDKSTVVVNCFVEQNAGGARTGSPQEQQVCHPQVALRLHREVEDQSEQIFVFYPYPDQIAMKWQKLYVFLLITIPNFH
jgi:hypothetical protein